jgi:enamine deaminase RidA (YjgF/YER057c/UK114 family)
MGRRRSIEVEGLHHGGAPVPQASLVASLLCSSGIAGLDPATGTLPDTLEGQVAAIFANVERIVAAAGGTVQDVAKVTFFARDRAASRAHIDREWCAMFPNEHSRPARHVLTYELPDPMLVQAEVLAFVNPEGQS